MAISNFCETVRLFSMASATRLNPASPCSANAWITRMPRTSKTLTSASLVSIASRADASMPFMDSAKISAI